MPGTPHLVPPPLPRRVEIHGPAHPQRTLLASVRWQVHVPGDGADIAGIALAGAEVELLPDRFSRLSEHGQRSDGTLLLTFWIERVRLGRPQREVLAAFIEDGDADPGLPGIAAQVASFEFASAGDTLSLEIFAEKSLLRIAQLSGTGERQSMVWCRSIIHELLGLGGGQYRLEEVRTDGNLVSRLVSHQHLAREAG